MSKVSVQFFRFANDASATRPGTPSVPAQFPSAGVVDTAGPRVELAVNGTATAGGNRPQNPAGSGFTHAVVIPITTEVLCASGADPVADQTSRLLSLPGLEYAVRVAEGDRLSFITRTA